MLKFHRLDHIQLAIPKGSEAEARDFYGGVLELEEIEKPDSLKPSGGVWYTAGNIELHLGIAIEEAKDGKEITKKEHPAFVIEELDEAKKYLLNEGVIIKEEIAIPGRNRFSFYDPFGNRIELLEYE
ncbi:MAG: VOC family protein [Ignavibacteria bacterium]|nr:VOC family protein [Ignavibacteria bacterium]MCC7158572.1 VOC family protein [Ignavibacteria bacterium]